MKNKEFITSYGLFCTLVVTIVGVGIFSYPRELVNVLGTDAWLESFLMGAISLLIIRFIWKVEKINDFMEFTLLVKKNLGRLLGSIILIIFAATLVFYMSVSMRTFVEVIKMYLLEKTPTEFILVVTILCGTYLVRGEIRSVIKFNEVALWTMFIPLIFILMFTFNINISDYTNILPIFHNKPIEYVNALRFTAFSFGGIEIAFLIIPFLVNKEKEKKALTKGIIFVTLFYAVVTVMVLAVFSKEHTKQLIWPTITMIKSLNIPGSFIERWEGIVMALWVLFYFTTFSNMYYFSSHILKETLKLGDVKISSLIIAPFIYIIAMIPKNIGEVFSVVTSVVPQIFIFNLIVLPLLLYFTSGAKCRKEEV